LVRQFTTTIRCGQRFTTKQLQRRRQKTHKITRRLSKNGLASQPALTSKHLQQSQHYVEKILRLRCFLAYFRTRLSTPRSVKRDSYSLKCGASLLRRNWPENTRKGTVEKSFTAYLLMRHFRSFMTPMQGLVQLLSARAAKIYLFPMILALSKRGTNNQLPIRPNLQTGPEARTGSTLAIHLARYSALDSVRFARQARPILCCWTSKCRSGSQVLGSLSTDRAFVLGLASFVLLATLRVQPLEDFLEDGYHPHPYNLLRLSQLSLVPQRTMTILGVPLATTQEVLL
jgi:hypothetical protein